MRNDRSTGGSSKSLQLNVNHNMTWRILDLTERAHLNLVHKRRSTCEPVSCACMRGNVMTVTVDGG